MGHKDPGRVAANAPGYRHDTATDNVDPAHLDGYRRLVAAILCQAWADATGRLPRREIMYRAEALDFLHGPGAEVVCDWLGRDVDTLRRRVGVDAT